MKPLQIAISNDHRGFVLKQSLLSSHIFSKLATGQEVVCTDCGAFDAERSDYPVFARSVALLVQSQQVQLGILLCGTGAGMAMAANRFKGVYAAVAWNAIVAQRVREEDNCNVLVLPADYLKPEEAIEIVAAWLGATFKQDRYAERIKLVDTF